MKCSEYENLITEYLENTASPSQRIQMESHLTECEKCRMLIESERSVIERLSALSIETCPDEIIDRVMATIPMPSCIPLFERIRSWFRQCSPMRYRAVSFAGSFIILLLLFFLYFPGQDNNKTKSLRYSTKEIQHAMVEAKLALAYFTVYSQKTERAFEKIDLTNPVVKPFEDGFRKAIVRIPYI